MIRPMNTGIVESSSATTKPAANNAVNRPFACRAKCQKNAMKPGGGSVRSGVSVGFKSRSKSANMGLLATGRARGRCRQGLGARCDPQCIGSKRAGRGASCREYDEGAETALLCGHEAQDAAGGVVGGEP